DAGTLLRRLLADPLRALGDGPALVLVLDALDEALGHGERNIARLLRERLEDLPDRVRLVVSARKDPKVLDLLRGGRTRLFDLGGAENLRDVTDFVRAGLSHTSLAEMMGRSGIDGEGLVCVLCDRSEGN